MVWHQHNPRNLMPDLLRRTYQRLTLYRQYGVIGKKAHLIILNPQVQHDIEKFGFRGQAFLLPNGIQTGRISFQVKDSFSIPVFLNFGGRADHKGLDILLRAVKILITKRLKFTIEITGGVDTEATVHSAFPHGVPNQIRIIPQTEYISAVFHGCNWFISASRRETFSYAIGEAMLSGTPVLSTDIPGVQWALGQKSVISVPPENPECLAKKMEDIIKGNIIVRGEDLLASRKFVIENYSVERWAEKLIKYYDSLPN